MAHDLFGERFFSHRQPAWHRLGTVLDRDTGAWEAFRTVGWYSVYMEPVVTATGIPLKQRAVIRSATKDDPEPRVFGLVGPEYELITPDEMCRIWDGSVNRPVETLGALGQGERLFMTTYLPTIDIRGEEVKNYLLLVSPMTGDEALEVRVTPVRVVCQNTLMMARAISADVYRIVHDRFARDRLREWLGTVYQRAEQRAEKIKEHLDSLAAHEVSGAEVERVLVATYPDPPLPREDAPEHVMRERMRRWEEDVESARRFRAAVRELFGGKGTGMKTKAASGTAWGLYNAVVELEDFRIGRTPISASQSALFGERARAKERAFDTCLALSNAGTSNAPASQ